MLHNKKMIPLSAPSLRGNEWKYVKDCLDTEWVSSAGKYVDKFEQDVVNYLGVKYAIACMNGTTALHISLILSGVKPSEEVIVPTITFIAPINAVKYVGAEPIFMDCDDYCTLDVNKVREFLEKQCDLVDGSAINKKTKRRIAALIPVHVFGNPVDMDSLLEVAQSYNVKVIEDATESLGSEYKGKKTGTLGLLGCLSFNGNKIITTGGGGMIVTNDERLAKRAKHLTTQAKEEGVEYIHNEIGLNYRLVNVLAAIGVAQLEKIDEYVVIKRKNFNLYKELFADSHYTLLDEPVYAKSNKWFYAVVCKDKKEKEFLLHHLNGNSIEVRPLWYLNHLQKPYINCQSYKIEKALKMYDTIINIPCSVNLTEKEIKEVVKVMSTSSPEEKYLTG
jgi:aminotransferase in exopolysaccharide biosynthesis